MTYFRLAAANLVLLLLATALILRAGEPPATPQPEVEFVRLPGPDAPPPDWEQLLITQLPPADMPRPPEELDWAYIPPGIFLRGAMDLEDKETPLQWVRIKKAFFVSRHEVTNEEYKAYLDDNLQVTQPPDWRFGLWPYSGQREYVYRQTCPVVNINLDDAKGYCKWKGVRLLTENEWEYIAKGGFTDLEWQVLIQKGPEDEHEINEAEWALIRKGVFTIPEWQAATDADIPPEVWRGIIRMRRIMRGEHEREADLRPEASPPPEDTQVPEWEPVIWVNRRFPWGQDFNWQLCTVAEGDREPHTTQGGTYARQEGDQGRIGSTPNLIHDLAGNVWEWTDTIYYAYTDTTTLDERFYTGPQPTPGADILPDVVYMVRGGSFLTNQLRCRTAWRQYESPEQKAVDLGFRVAADANAVNDIRR